jgi:prepilin-type N-terminal cleavage/methylation domain-containing protein
MNRRRGFSLIELMIVILLLSMLTMLAAPQIRRSREVSSQTACMGNLRVIDYAKEHYAGVYRLPVGAVVDPQDLQPVFFKGTGFPVCPSGGTYTLHPIGQSPVCSLAVASRPHVLR